MVEMTAGGTEVQCHKCNYEWKYSGEMQMATCPSCNTKTAASGPDEYKHASVIRLTSPDPRNGHDVGAELVRAGLYEHGDDYAVRDGAEEVTVETETAEIYTFNSPVSKEQAIELVFDTEADEVLNK